MKEKKVSKIRLLNKLDREASFVFVNFVFSFKGVSILYISFVFKHKMDLSITKLYISKILFKLSNKTFHKFTLSTIWKNKLLIKSVKEKYYQEQSP